MVLLPPEPPRPAQTSGFNCFIITGWMAGGCCAKTDAAEITAAAASTEISTVFIAGPFPQRTIDPGNPKAQIPNAKSEMRFGMQVWGFARDLGFGIWAFATASNTRRSRRRNHRHMADSTDRPVLLVAGRR